jgi:hypothetical protein
MCQAFGVAACFQGLRRYYALLLRRDAKAQLVKVLDSETALMECDFAWEFGRTYELSLETQGNRLIASIDGNVLFDYTDKSQPLTRGAVGLVCEEGRAGCEWVSVEPAKGLE